MFSGIIEQTGRVEAFEKGSEPSRLTINPDRPSDWELGESISVNGVCLSLVSLGDQGLEFDLSEETLRRSNLGALKPGDLVNLEQALKMGERLGGHFVSGHVDGQARLEALRRQGGAAEMDFSMGKELLAMLAEKGAITLDGVSLTPFGIQGSHFSVALIPATLSATTLGFKSVGDFLNVEIDLLARYVKQLLGPR